MKLSSINYTNYKYFSGPDQKNSVSKQTSDGVNFKALKKTQLAGLTLACACMFKAPLEKFNSEYDLQDWALDNINIDFEDSSLDNIPLRKQRLDNWKNYLLSEMDISLTKAEVLVIYSSILKDLKPENKKIPPPINSEVLEFSLKEIKDKLKEDRSYTFNFNKIYQKNLKLNAITHMPSELDVTNTGWIYIPSQLHDLENFPSNIERLRNFSYKTWCTKDYNAHAYLAGGDFHIYLKNGEPKVAIRLYNNHVIEIEGEKNNKTVPWQYVDVIKKRILDKNLKTLPKIDKGINNSEEIAEKIKTIKSDLGSAIDEYDIKRIFNYFNIKCTEEISLKTIINKIKNRIMGREYKPMYILDSFYEPNNFKYSDLGLNENKIFKSIKKISKNANFEDSQITSLGNLESVGGNLILRKSNIINLGELKYIGGKININDSELENTCKLTKINGIKIQPNIKIKELPKESTYQ